MCVDRLPNIVYNANTCGLQCQVLNRRREEQKFFIDENKTANHQTSLTNRKGKERWFETLLIVVVRTPHSYILKKKLDGILLYWSDDTGYHSGL